MVHAYSQKCLINFDKRIVSEGGTKRSEGCRRNVSFGGDQLIIARTISVSELPCHPPKKMDNVPQLHRSQSINKNSASNISFSRPSFPRSPKRAFLPFPSSRQKLSREFYRRFMIIQRCTPRKFRHVLFDEISDKAPSSLSNIPCSVRSDLQAISRNLKLNT